MERFLESLCDDHAMSIKVITRKAQDIYAGLPPSAEAFIRGATKGRAK